VASTISNTVNASNNSSTVNAGSTLNWFDAAKLAQKMIVDDEMSDVKASVTASISANPMSEIDTNGDGKITVEELEEAKQKDIHLLAQSNSGISESNFKASLAEAELFVSSEEKVSVDNSRSNNARFESQR